MNAQARKPEAEPHGEHVLRRIAALTLGLGVASAVLALALHRPDWAKGLVGGAILGWLNFRWLSRGIRAMMLEIGRRATRTEEGTPAPAQRFGTPVRTYLALVFRYVLVGLGAYVIFICLHVPLVSIGLGLCALVAAIVAASVWEVLKPEA